MAANACSARDLDDAQLTNAIVDGLDAFTGRRDVLAEAIYEEVLATYGHVDPERAENLYCGLIGAYEQAHDVTGGSNTVNAHRKRQHP